MSWLDDASAGVNRFMLGNNDAPAVDPRLMNRDIFGGTQQWTEADYQRALQAWKDGISGPGGIPGAPELNPGMANVNLQRQHFNPLVQSLSDAAQGKGPSQAQDALREGTATNIATQFGSAATPSVGGAAQAALYGNAQNNAAQAMQTGARQGAQLRAQEMTDARQQLGTALNQQQGLNLQAVGLQTEREKANQNASIGAGSINSQVGEQNRGGLLSMWGKFWSDIRAKEDIQPMSSFKSTIQDSPAFKYVPQDSGAPFAFKQYLQDAPKASPQKLDEGGGDGIFGGLFSDERSKEKIRSLEGALAESRRTSDTIGSTRVQYPQLAQAGLDLERRSVPTARFDDLATPNGSRAALAPVEPYSYRYKPEFAAAMGTDRSPRAGIMAQDLELSPNPALRSAVIDTPMGKAIEPKRAISANLALSAGLDKRLRNIEQGMSAPVQYPNLVMSDKESKDTIRVLSEALAAKPAVQATPAATGTALIPEGSRLVTPWEDSARKVARMQAGIPDPYGESRGAIEQQLVLAPTRGRWDMDSADPDYELQGRMPAPRMY